MPSVSIITVSSADGVTTHVDASNGPGAGARTHRIATGPAPVMVTVQDVDLAAQTIETTFRDWCNVGPGAEPLPRVVHVVPAPSGGHSLQFGDTHDVARPVDVSTKKRIAKYNKDCRRALEAWQAACKKELPCTFSDRLLARTTAETTSDPEHTPPTVDMGFPAMAAAHATPVLLRAILRDMARYAEAAFGGVALTAASSLNVKRTYAAVGLGSTCRPCWTPEARAEDDRALSFGLNEDCDDFVIRTASIINALNRHFAAPANRAGLSSSERGVLSALDGQTPVFAFVRAKPPHATRLVGHAVCLLTSEADGQLKDPWLVECTTSTVPNLWEAPAGAAPSTLYRVAQPGEYARLLTTITPTNVTYYFTKVSQSPLQYKDGVNLERMLKRSGSGPALAPGEIARTRTAEAGPDVGESIRQKTNWAEAIAICRAALDTGGIGGASSGTSVAITPDCASWNVGIDGNCALYPLMGWLGAGN